MFSGLQATREPILMSQSRTPIQLSLVEPATIYIVGTGGTIAGTATSATSANYNPSQLNVDDLIKTMPEIKKFSEELKGLDLFKVHSEDMTPMHWLDMAKTVNALLLKPEVTGVIITHGTDTLEETAYFLDLVIKSDKPVVIVGSMRASTSLSADGPLNLFNAVSVIHDPNSKGKGVMVVMNDNIYDGRNVTKCNTTQVDTFNAPNVGPIGRVHYGKVTYTIKELERRHTTKTPFDITDLIDLPTVEIVSEYAGAGNVLKAVIAQKPDGIVISGVGDGNLTAKDRALIKYAKDSGIHIVRSSRTGSGYVTESDDPSSEYADSIAGDNLNPQKARILLMLSLTKTKQLCEIKKNFATY